ncbi:hypothetical protein SLS54_006484 [Diplodia seriata]
MVDSELDSELHQEFRVWIESQKIRGIGAPGAAADPSYVPQQRVVEYFKASKTISQLLQRLKPDGGLEAYQSTISKEYPKVLCVLLIIGQGRQIETFVRYTSLCDTRLPFDHKPANFPFAYDGSDFFGRFKEVQWQFCAQPLTYNMNLVYEDARILPIMTKDPIGRGGTSNIFKITLPQAYDELEPHGSSEKKHAGFRHAHTYVVKTYCTRDAKSLYSNEIRAFRRVLAAGSNQGFVPGLIGFHGNFTHGGTHNVLLEYADKGTLEQYFNDVPPPTTEEDILSFWRGLFFPILALLKIHNLNDQDLENADFFQGWHQDIKPDNILVISNDRPSAYKYEFKLADLGLSHFRKPQSATGEMTDTDAWGTKTYGAPETYRNDSLVGPASLRVTKSVDIWSLGCVYSEAATWLVLGKEGLQKYRADRKEETDKIPNHKDDASFHNGEKMLSSVERTHHHIVERKRRTDHITRAVLLNMVQEMLGEESARPTAKQLWVKSQMILRQAKDARQSSMWSSSNGSPSSSRTPTLKDAPQEPQAGTHPNSRAQSAYAPIVRGSIRIDTGHSITGERRRIEHSPERIQGTPQDAGSPPQAHSPSDARHSNQYSSSTGRPSTSQPERTSSYWSVDAAYLWEKAQRTRRLKAKSDPEGGERFMELISKRDHVFIVDDSNSMRSADWSLVTSRFSLLAYIVKVADPDGLDLYFSSSSKRIHSNKSSELTEAVKKRHSLGVGHENLRMVLETVFELFRASFFGSGSGKSFFGKRVSKRGKPMTCYILTDGAWCSDSNCDLERVIREFVDELLRKETQPRDFGIQFISFGSHQEGLDTLQHLDSGLRLPRDIVDTESASGDVWKMLLGSINKIFDGDAQEHPL